MQTLAPIVTVPRRFWDEGFRDAPLPKEVTVTFEVAGQPTPALSTRGFVSVTPEDSELRLSGLWAASHDHFPGYVVVGWSKEGDENIRLQLQPPETGNDDQTSGLDRKRRAPADLPEPQAKVQAVGASSAAESPAEQVAQGGADWRQDARDGAKSAVETPHRLVAPPLMPGGRAGARRGGGGGRARGGSRGNSTGRGCAKLVRTTTRLYIGVGQVREWLGEVGARTELQVKVMLDNRMLLGVHQADLLYNKGAHYYWITSRTLKRTAMGKWFLGWNHTQSDGLVLLLRSPSKDEIAAAIAEGFQAKEEEDEELSELQQQLQQQQQPRQQQGQQGHQQQQPPLAQALSPLSPPSPLQGRLHQARSLAALASAAYADEDSAQQQPQQLGASELDDAGDGGQHQRLTPLAGGVRLGGPGDDDEASGLSGDSGLRRALGPSDPRLVAALAAEFQKGRYAAIVADAQPLGQRASQALSGGHGSRLAYSAGPDSLDFQQQSLQQQQSGGNRTRSGSALGVSSIQAQYRTASGRTASEGLNTQAAGAAAAAAAPLPRLSGGPTSRVTNFAEVPGGSAFGNVPMPAEAMTLEPQPLMSQPPPHQRSITAVPSLLNATTSIASNLSLAGATQLTGAPSILQTSGIAGPIVAPIRLPGNVSELLPPELLPAAVSVRCTLDGALVPEVFSCEIHRSRQGHCYLYNLPPGVLEGRAQQDWMISEDGCLVLCMTSPPQGPTLVENISVRSNPSKGTLAGVTADVGGSSIKAQIGTEEPGHSRPQRKASAAEGAAPSQWHGPAARAAPTGTPGAGMHHEASGAEAAAAAAADAWCVKAELPADEARQGPGRARATQMPVPRQAIESLYGAVELPLPVLVRYQVDREMDSKVYLAEVVDADGELVLRGIPADALSGRTLVGWSRASVLSHQLLVICVESRSEAGAQQAKTAAQAPARADPGSRGEQQGGLERSAMLSGQQPQPSLQWAGSSELPQVTRRVQTYGQQQCSMSVTPAPSSTLPTPRPSLQLQLTTTGPSHGQPQRQQLQSGDSVPLTGTGQLLQSVPSGLLPGVGSSKLPTSMSHLNTPSGVPPESSALPRASSDGAAPAGTRWRVSAGGSARSAGGVGGYLSTHTSASPDSLEAAPQRGAPAARFYALPTAAEAAAIVQAATGSSALMLGFGASPQMELAPASRRHGGSGSGATGNAAASTLGPLGLEYVPVSSPGPLHSAQPRPQRSLQQPQHAPRRESGSQGLPKGSGSWDMGHSAGGDLDAAGVDRGRRYLGVGAGGTEGDAGAALPAAGPTASLRFASAAAGGSQTAPLGAGGGRPLEAAGPLVRDALPQRSRAQVEAVQAADAQMQLAAGEWRLIKLEQQSHEEDSVPSIEPSLRAHLATGPGRASVSSVQPTVSAADVGRPASWQSAHTAAGDASNGGRQGFAAVSARLQSQLRSLQRAQEESPWRQQEAQQPANLAAEPMDEDARDPAGAPSPVPDTSRLPLRGAIAEAGSTASGGGASLQGYAAYGMLSDTPAEESGGGQQRSGLWPPLGGPALRARMHDAAPMVAEADGAGLEQADGEGGGGGQGEHAEQQTRAWQWGRDAATRAEGTRRERPEPRHDAPEMVRPLGSGSAAARPGLLPAGAASAEQTWYPRLDLAGATASDQDTGGRGEAEAGAADGVEEQGSVRPGDDAQSLEGHAFPRRSTVLRMLSSVRRESEGGESPRGRVAGQGLG